MATHGSAAGLLANGYDLGQFLSSLAQANAVDSVDVTTFSPVGQPAPSSKSYIPGLASGSLDGDGVWSADVTGLTLDLADDILQAALRTAGGARSHCTYLPLGDGFGNLAIGVDGNETKYDITSPVSDVVKAAVSIESCVARETMQVAHALAAEVAGGNGADLDYGAAYTVAVNGITPQSLYRGGVLYVHLLDLIGVGTLNVKAQHSVDGATWVDLVPNQALTAKHQAARGIALGAAGSVNRHLRILWTIAGFTSVTFHAAIGRVKI
jgi:hypothetical protein